MKNIKLMNKFIVEVEKKQLLTELVRFIKDNNQLNEYNYIYRKSIIEDNLIIDIYDNISINCFNRYIFSFDKNNHRDIITKEDNNIYIHYIPIYNSKPLSQNNVAKLAYLFSLNSNDMADYSKEILNESLSKILILILKDSR